MSGVRYLSVCSGIEAATVAWHGLGWQVAAFSEIETFPAAVLAHHYPETPNLGDMTGFKEWPDDAGIDLLVGGTPCQSFSVAGLRQGLDDPRGNLALVYLALADRYRPRWLLWENVPGVLSSNGGRDFGAILGALGKLGYGWAYRVLDAQYFGVPQRRRRVFLVGYSGGWGGAAAVLFEPESLRGDSPPRREAGEGSAGVVIKGAAIGREPEHGPQYGEILEDGSCYTLNCTEQHAVTVALRGRNGGATAEVGGEQATALRASQGGGDKPHVLTDAAVRRLTPRECERLQGFPDDYTLISWRGKPAADGPRYKALGNSMAVPVMAWLGGRIAVADAVLREAAA